MMKPRMKILTMLMCRTCVFGRQGLHPAREQWIESVMCGRKALMVNGGKPKLGTAQDAQKNIMNSAKCGDSVSTSSSCTAVPHALRLLLIRSPKICKDIVIDYVGDVRNASLADQSAYKLRQKKKISRFLKSASRQMQKPTQCARRFRTQLKSPAPERHSQCQRALVSCT